MLVSQNVEVSLDSIGQPLMALFPRSRVRIVAVSPFLPLLWFFIAPGCKKRQTDGASVTWSSQTGATTLSFFDHGTARHARMQAPLQLLKFHPYRAGLKSGPQVARVPQAS